VYPRFYLAGDTQAQIPSDARAINDSMPAYAVELLEREMDAELRGQTVLILGVSYRGAVKETAFSAAFAVQRELERRGARALAHDPMYEPDELRALGFAPWDGSVTLDAAILQADHPAYTQLTPADLPGVRAIIDGRGTLDAGVWAAAGVPVRRIGSPG
jgi:UDP-N-acetyl-D-mannosaminuronic acid dehydrogenase